MYTQLVGSLDVPPHTSTILRYLRKGAKQEVSMDMCERLCKIVQSLSLVDSGNTQETLLAIAQAGLQTLPRSLELLVTLGIPFKLMNFFVEPPCRHSAIETFR